MFALRCLLLVLLTPVAIAEEPLVADDECRDAVSCGLNALQMRGMASVVPTLPDFDDIIDDNEDDDDDDDDDDDEEATTPAPAGDATAGKDEDDAEEEEEETTTVYQPLPEDANCSKPDAQCGGQWFYGTTCCWHGYECFQVNQYFSQCVTAAKAEELANLATETTTTTTTTNEDPMNCQLGFQQCGGYDEDTKTNWTGKPCCYAGFTCAEKSAFFSQCKPTDKNSSFLPYEPTKALEEPSDAPLYTFYVYRAASENDDFVENINVGNLAGTLWYLHNEVVWVRPRKFNIDKIIRYKITTKATTPLKELGMNFGVRFSFDTAMCTGPWNCELNFEKYGYFVGCNNLGMFPFPTYDTHYPEAKWFSLPGQCPTKAWEEKDANCTKLQPGGRCDTPTGQGNCTYSIEEVGSLTLDEIEGLTSYHDFIHTGGVEFNKTLDNGTGLTFWNNLNDTEKNVERVEKVSKMFEEKFPDQPKEDKMEAPKCDFDFEKFYGEPLPTTTTTTTVSTSAVATEAATAGAAATEAATTEEATTEEATTEAATTEAATTESTTTEAATTAAATTVAATTKAAKPVAAVPATPTTMTTTPYGCEDAVLGSHCYSAVTWAMEHGLKLHPTWYPGLTATSSFSDFQARVHHVHPKDCPVPCTKKAGCHTPKKGESCHSAVLWAMEHGITLHPSWYPGLTKASSFDEFQMAVHKATPKKCPLPCA
ncbi:unnamed protein product [Effrenium voratum]|nr:unnamed protein product [Effrenium voratum]